MDNAAFPTDAPFPPDAIAIVGMAGRFPGAKSIDEFWKNQRAGKISISQFSEEELEDWFDPETRAADNFVRARGVLEDADMFDAGLFEMYAREAELTDPQHRVFLEITLEAVERAGIDPKRFAGPIGVFAGASMPTYLLGNVLAGHADAMEFNSNYQLGGIDTLVGSLPDALATRVAYKLDLRGPAITVQSACSTSLLAVAQACQSLLFYQCDAALAGGVSITFPQKRGYLYQDGGMGSRDGTCRPFDAEACGTVFGSGAAVVVLKRLEDALRDGDHIHALIRGCGIANDGAGKVAFTAPSAEGQAAAISAAIAEAGVDPATIGYIELHGTATPLGDPIEFAGLKHALGGDDAPLSCALGSTKANIGHLDAAAGVTGLIKTALCLEHGEIPPLANFTAPNPHIDLDGSGFRIERELTEWQPADGPRRAGVSAFGVGGTNVHVVMEQAPARSRETAPETVQALTFSAKTSEALEAQAQALAQHLRQNPDVRLADVAFTLAEGRAARPERGAVVARTAAEAAGKLAEFAKRGIRGSARQDPPVVFMFPGQGSQYPGMGATLYRTESAYGEWINRGAELLRGTLDRDIRELLFADLAGAADEAHPIRSTVHAQPALFLTQYALAKLWQSRGIQPAAMIGHSVGELVAACLAGVLSFEDGLSLVARRAALMQSAERGAMLVVRLPESELLPMLGDGVDLAAVNAPSLCVAAGPFEAIERLEAKLAAKGSEGRRLHTSHAFHSAMMDPVVGELEKLARTFDYGKPAIPYVSCVTGEWANGHSANGAYWAKHCREPVRFADALHTAVGEQKPLLLEVGPGRTLSTFAAQGLTREDYLGVIPSMPDFAEAERDLDRFMEAAARLWTHGAKPDWQANYGEGAKRTPLPAYQFQRKRYWIEPAPRGDPLTFPAAQEQSPGGQIINPASIALAASTTGAQPVAATVSRIRPLSSDLAKLLEELSGESLQETDWTTEFLELGFDSLFLGQVVSKLQRKFGVKVTFRQLMGEFSTIDALARHLDETLPPEAPAETLAAPAASSNGIVPLGEPTPIAQSLTLPIQAVPVAQAGDFAATFQAQLQAMQSVIDRQLALLGNGSTVEAAPLPITAPQTPAAVAAAGSMETASTAPAMDSSSDGSRFRPYNPKTATDNALTDAQSAFISDLSHRYCAKMPSSKAQTQAHRPYFSDPRSAAGFRPEWKEMVFPVVAARSKGSKIWDVDGNEFVDLVNGYGQTAFGHAPDFVTEAVARQLEQGFAIGPQAPLAGEVAARISRMVGLERVTFCNTGSEAVMAAMRVARCVTGRDKVVVFNNDYHGQFDEVLVKSGGKAALGRAQPIAPGIPPESVENMVVLPYGSPDALDWIRKNANDIAAVIVEPVQSRHPDLLPFDFVRELRRITEADEVALVFDEVVTGFRTHPGGMQAVIGVKADMATYGKVIGGGMPVGLLAGSARFMDALDGGSWNFGDDSVPEVAPTFFAGTFVRHPLVMAACNAVLDHLEAEGPELQSRLAARTAGLVERINAEFAGRGVAVQAPTYSSWFMLDIARADRLGALFHYHMRLLGVHVMDAYPCFLTTAHSDADLDLIVNATAESIDALQSAGILLPQGQSAAPVPMRQAGPREVPMTEPQLEILLAAQIGPEASCAFNESLTLEFDGPVNASALAGALDDFVARHDAMRATVKEGEAVLTISPEPHIPMAVISNVDDAELERIRGDEARKPFDLVNGPLLRAVLAEKKNGCAALVFTAHHIVFDGWTVNILTHELAAFYRARTGGEMAQLDPALSYADYALSKAVGNPEAEAHLDYWREVFADVPAPIELPGDRPRPGIKSFAGATFIDMIDADLTAATRKAGAKLGCTLFATLFGALQATLGRIAECEDVVLGCPTAGQSAIEDGVLAGHCVNFLPMRAPFTMATPIGEHLRAVKTMALEALEHGSATYGAIVRSLGLPHDLNRTPLTDVQFNLEQLGEAIDFGGTSADLRANPKASVNFALFFNMVETGQGLRVEVDYASDLFDESTIARWVENLRQTLRGIAADASTPIGELDILGAGECAWLDARNPVWPRLADDCSVPSEFARAAAAYPDHVALACNGRTMTYAELEARSNRLAHALRARGIGKGDFVALLSGRSIEAIEMILGVIKTGAAYVPLDPAYPPARQAYVLEDCGARLLLLGPAAQEAEAFAELRERGLDYEALSMEATGLSSEPLDHVVHGDDPIYVMYTSGSTGKPKGVVVPHRGVVRLVVDQDYVELGPDETLMLLTALGFDLCQFEIWGALLFGGKLAIVPQTKPSLDDISQVIVEEGVTTALLAAALFHLICEERMAALAPLRQLVIGADVVSRTLVRRAQEALPHLRFVNGYGPTENSGLTTCYVFPPEGWGSGSSPIGQPIARSTAYIMDRRGRLSPQGAIGELWSGGEGVAIGYLGKPELTDEKFVPHPDDPAQRLYRTGDYARWRNDGAIEFFGRIDGQLKINGMRVELDEIEAVLCEVEGVGEAAVTVRSVPSGGKTVHAFVTTARGREFDSAALDHHVAERLPHHMQPAMVELIDKLPLNANGKVDRAALLKLIGSTQGAPRGAPQLVELNALEATVGAIWEEVLGVEKVRHDDALFDLGADSLQIFRISARMADKGYRLDNRKLLANPTLSEVCEMLTAVLQKNEPAKEAAKIAPLSAYRRTAMRETA